MGRTLIYVHDPMCSWCYGFGPALAGFIAGMPPQVQFRRLLGGLASDTDEPMPEDLKARLQGTWRRIQARIPGTDFNFDFWTRCAPRRSTYRACRAVIAARTQDPSLDQAMTAAIQRAYYRQALNPSDRDTLIALAEEIGANQGRFAAALDAPATQATLAEEIAEARALGVSAFPALVLDCNGSRWPVPLDYREPRAMLAFIDQLAETTAVMHGAR